MKLLFRQGDVYFFEVDKIEKELKKVDKQVLAKGEVTGHKHLLVKERETTQLEIANDGIGFYLKVSDGDAIVKHEEHEAITLSPNTYKIIIQREYDPIQYQRKVQD